MPPETEALPGDGRRILFAELAFDPARKDYGPYGQVRIIGHAAPQQRDQRCGPQLHGLRHDDQIAAIGTEDILGVGMISIMIHMTSWRAKSRN